MAHADPQSVLTEASTVAVVGCSTSPHKDAHRIPALLQDAGFEVWPVNPTATEILGQPCVPDLASLPQAPDLVVVFRPSAETPAVTQAAVEVGAKAVWLQLGISSPEAAAIAAEAGIDYVEDRCSGIDVRRFGIRKVAS